MSGPTDLPEIDELLGLLADVASRSRFTNRLNEEVLVVPVEVMTEIRRILGTLPWLED